MGKIIDAKVSDFIQDGRNANIGHSKKIATSIRKLGLGRSIVVDKNNVIIAGNGVQSNAESEGIQDAIIVETTGDRLVVVKRTDIDINSKIGRELAIADNVTAKEGIQFDMQVIDSLMSDFYMDMSLMPDVNFEMPDDLQEYQKEGDNTKSTLQAEEDDFDIPEIDKIKTDIVYGDLFELTDSNGITHRLLCGDATNKEDIGKLMNGEKASMVFTDPPYDIENESYSDNIELFTKDAHVFVMHDDKGIVNYLRRSRLDFIRFFVADFIFSSPRGNDPYLRHILVSQEKNGNAIKHQNLHDGFGSIVKMEYRGNLKDDETAHKHQKSISFVSKFINHYSIETNIICDLFGGSGTTLIAASQLKRMCYINELEPKYCQVIINRFSEFDKGLKIKKLN